MLEKVLQKKNLSKRAILTVKGAVTLGVIALAVGLPQLVHLAAGATGGAKWLPMYLPVLIGGCLLGVWWGLGIGIAAPTVSFLVTAAAGNPMPVAARLPYMIVELAVFGAIGGLFSKSIYKNVWMAFPATLFAIVGGRCVFMAVAAIFQSVSPLSGAAAWQQVQTGLLAVVLQAVIVPAVVIGLKLLLDRDKKEKTEE